MTIRSSETETPTVSTSTVGWGRRIAPDFIPGARAPAASTNARWTCRREPSWSRETSTPSGRGSNPLGAAQIGERILVPEVDREYDPLPSRSPEEMDHLLAVHGPRPDDRPRVPEARPDGADLH